MLNLAAPKSNTALIALRIKNNSVRNNYSEPFWKGLSRNSWLTQACPLSPPVLLRGPGPRPCRAVGSAPPTAPFPVPLPPHQVPQRLTETLRKTVRPPDSPPTLPFGGAVLRSRIRVGPYQCRERGGRSAPGNRCQQRRAEGRWG